MSGRWTKAATVGLLLVTLAGCSPTAAPKKKGTAAEPMRKATSHVTRGTDRMIRGATGRGTGNFWSGLWGTGGRGTSGTRNMTGAAGTNGGAGTTRGTWPVPATGAGGRGTGGTGSFGASSTRMGTGTGVGTGGIGPSTTRMGASSRNGTSGTGMTGAGTTGNTGMTGGAAGTGFMGATGTRGGTGATGMGTSGMTATRGGKGTTGMGTHTGATGMTGASRTRTGGKGMLGAAGTTGTGARKPLSVIGFFTEDASKKGLTALGRDPKAVSDLSPWWYTLKADGTVVDKSTATTRAWASAHKVPLVPLVTNGGESKVLEDGTAMRTAVEKLTQIAHKNNYAGLNVDFQGLPATARSGLNAFVDELAHNLHAMHKTLAVDIIPTQAQTGAGGAYDEHTLAAYADRLVLMTYDRHDDTSAAGPVSPHNWVVSAVQHALQSGVPAKKILLGVNSYGYDWNTSTGKGTTIGQAQAAALPAKDQHYSAATREIRVTYTKGGVQHVVYYGGRKALSDKIAIAKKYKLSGIAIWKIGYENQAFWQELLKKNGDAASGAATSGAAAGSAASHTRTGHGTGKGMKGKPMTHRPIGTRSGSTTKHGGTTGKHGGTARSHSGKMRGKK